MTGTAVGRDVLEIAERIGATVAGPAASAVDREARFPREAFAALRQERMLGAWIPTMLGGRGSSAGDVAEVCQILGRHCASTGMIYAMHQIQVACLVRHGMNSKLFRDYLGEIASHEWLLASATSEMGVGGDLRTSVCAIETTGGRFSVQKQAPVVSYGEEADGILLTARRSPEAAGNDQVCVLLHKAELTLTRTSGWDSLGMRGTCSLGFTVSGTGDPSQILPAPFGDIAAQTMLPVSHILWASLWLGVASDAVAKARACVRSEARKSPGTVPASAQRLAETVAELHTMRAIVQTAVQEYERVQDDPEILGSLGFAIRMNNVKVTASRMIAEIVTAALGVTGIAGYKLDSKYALGRHIRDAHSAALMIANDRILRANATMLLVQKDD